MVTLVLLATAVGADSAAGDSDGPESGTTVPTGPTATTGFPTSMSSTTMSSTTMSLPPTSSSTFVVVTSRPPNPTSSTTHSGPVPTTTSIPRVPLPFPADLAEPDDDGGEEPASPAPEPARPLRPTTSIRPTTTLPTPVPTTAVDTTTVQSIPMTVTTGIVLPFVPLDGSPPAEPVVVRVLQPLALVASADITTDERGGPTTTPAAGPTPSTTAARPRPSGPQEQAAPPAAKNGSSLLWPAALGLGCAVLLGGPFAVRKWRRLTADDGG